MQINHLGVNVATILRDAQWGAQGKVPQAPITKCHESQARWGMGRISPFSGDQGLEVSRVSAHAPEHSPGHYAYPLRDGQAELA